MMTMDERATDAAPEDARDLKGIWCPRCRCTRKFRVDTTRPMQRSIHRYRACTHCGQHVVTAEITLSELNRLRRQ